MLENLPKFDAGFFARAGVAITGIEVTLFTLRTMDRRQDQVSKSFKEGKSTPRIREAFRRRP